MNTDRPLDVSATDPEINAELNDLADDELRVKDFYRGFFIRFEPIDEKGKGILASSNCIIGGELFLDFTEEEITEEEGRAAEFDGGVNTDADADAGTDTDVDANANANADTKESKVASGPFSSVKNAVRVAKGEISEEEMYGIETPKPKKERFSELGENAVGGSEKSGQGGARAQARKREQFGAKLINKGGDVITLIDKSDSDNIKKFVDDGWNVKLILSLIVFKNESNRFWGEAIVICYKEDTCINALTLPNYIKHLRKRINSGEHPQASLSQKQFDKVLETQGEWNLVPSAPFPKLGKGELIYKRKISWNERLLKPAAEGNKGCTIASIVAWILIAAIVIWLLTRTSLGG